MEIWGQGNQITQITDGEGYTRHTNTNKTSVDFFAEQF